MSTTNPRLIMQKPGFQDALCLLGISLEEWWFTIGRYLEARDELVKLRVSLARIAQALEVSRQDVPGTESWAFQDLNRAASNNERGWNRLAAIAVDEIVNLRAQVGRLEDEVGRMDLELNEAKNMLDGVNNMLAPRSEQ